jgi:hypothetical protein
VEIGQEVWLERKGSNIKTLNDMGKKISAMFFFFGKSKKGMWVFTVLVLQFF